MTQRRTIDSPLADMTMTNPEKAGLSYEPGAMIPDVEVMKIGSQSITARGREAVFPALDALLAAKARLKMLLCCGGGTRARHIYAVASDHEMPTGALAALGGYVPRQ